MKRRHLTLTDIATASRLTKDDRRYRHLETCARCRMLRMRYEQFVLPPDDLPSADLRDAEARLAEMLADQVAPAEAPDRSPRPGIEVLKRPIARRRPSGFRTFALAAAAVALVVTGTFLARRTEWRGDRASGVMRGADRRAAGTELRQVAPLTLEGARVRLGWQRDPAADRYEVHLYSPELRSLAVLGTGRETTLVLLPGTIAGAAAGDTLLWRVFGFRGEQGVAKTGLGIVRLP